MKHRGGACGRYRIKKVPQLSLQILQFFCSATAAIGWTPFDVENALTTASGTEKYYEKRTEWRNLDSMQAQCFQTLTFYDFAAYQRLPYCAPAFISQTTINRNSCPWIRTPPLRINFGAKAGSSLIVNCPKHEPAILGGTCRVHKERRAAFNTLNVHDPTDGVTQCRVSGRWHNAAQRCHI